MNPSLNTTPLQLSQEAASLLKRLAGPSSGKAGLSKDQTEVNRIISEASKGSKFYENEKKKDKEVTTRIEKILKQKQEVTQEVDLLKVEYTVDQLIRQLEAQRDLTQIIVHVDMDAFYANVELLDNPKLEGKPFAVGKGVVSTASYEARKFGVRSGMAGFIAKKLCPNLIFISNHFSRYLEMSEKVMDIFHRYDPNMCPAGCDEGYLNITSYCEANILTAEECVKQMRNAVLQETKLTVSAGIAPNKMLAKICSDKNKPNGQFQLQFDPESIKAFMCELSIRKVPGIGRTCGDIFTQRAIVSLMDKQFGLVFLLRTYLGISSNIVHAHQREERKSIGAERTFAPIEDLDKILAKLDDVAAELEKDMEQTGWTGRTLTLKFKLDTYQVFTRAKSLNHWVSRKEELYSIGKELLLPETPLKIRLIGLRVTKLKDLRDSGSSTNGIKRFFESVKGDEGPRKKAKLDDDDVEEYMEDSMPDFHENDENDYKLEDDEIEVSIESIEAQLPVTVSVQKRAPQSTSNAQASSSKPQPSAKPRRNSESVSSDPKSSTSTSTLDLEAHLCPICHKTLKTDNQGLNTHVDFCLSRKAIMDAQIEASNPTPKKFTGWPKPESSIKAENKRIFSKGKSSV